jgi:hypothetical protein
MPWIEFRYSASTCAAVVIDEQCWSAMQVREFCHTCGSDFEHSRGRTYRRRPVHADCM